MPIVAAPDIGIPFPFDTTPEELDDFREKAKALVRTIEELEAGGLDVSIADEDRAASHEMLATEKVAPTKSLTPGAIKHLDAILSEYDREILDVHVRLRTYIVNKLIAETVDPDAKVRLKALEMLGKLSSVGSFAERIDVNVTHRTVQDIEAELKKTLSAYSDYTDAEIEAVPDPTAVAITEQDLDAELGPTTDVGP